MVVAVVVVVVDSGVLLEAGTPPSSKAFLALLTTKQVSGKTCTRSRNNRKYEIFKPTYA